MVSDEARSSASRGGVVVGAAHQNQLQVVLPNPMKASWSQSSVYRKAQHRNPHLPPLSPLQSFAAHCDDPLPSSCLSHTNPPAKSVDPVTRCALFSTRSYVAHCQPHHPTARIPSASSSRAPAQAISDVRLTFHGNTERRQPKI